MDENFLKLINATYQLFEYFPESDSLKTRAKEKVLAIMEEFILISGENSNKVKISEDIEIILGYLKIGKFKGWISQINYLIVSTEYKKIINQFSLIDRNTQVDIKKELKAESIKISSNNVLDKHENQKKEPHNLKKLSDRQQKIIKFLSEKKEAQVMDLQTVLPNVTKRTIRRDLDELLSIGQIIRMGQFNQVFYKVS